MVDDAALTIPPAGLDDTDEQRRRLAATLRPELTMPPAGTGAPSAPPSAAFGGMIPPAPIASPQPRPSAPVPASVMPPAPIGAPPSAPKPAPTMPPAPVQAPQTPEPRLHGWRKYVDSIGSIFPIGRAIETGIPGTPQNWEEKQAQQAARTETGQRIAKGMQELESSKAKAQFETPEKRRAYMEQHPDEFQGISDFERNDFILQGKFPQGEGGLAGKTPEETTLHDLMAGDNGNPRVNPDTNKPYTYLEAYKETKQAGEKPPAREHFPPGDMVADASAPGGFRQVGTKSERLTDPFEAFAYGTPEQKKAAQDFLDYEKKAGARYEKPGEIEQRYDLFQKDPDAYRQMFGDKGGAQDQAQASRMLRFFDSQRKQIEGDWTLDEPTKAQKLAEIKELEQPYLNPAAAQGGAPGKAGAAQFKTGQTVYDKQGNPRKIKNVLKDGRLELE